ncbi:SH3 domain-containing protein [Kaistia terrae]|uniref:SH3 domain-containing protein n=1 Tax=Kaistia terrae TaxID=537017 RepID=A0ABW0PXP4_9HYPH|nr:SH3 domain-containing protein [Kaistia terrae]MCX5581004.1 hypothetical protein [Kaistia terrae]
MSTMTHSGKSGAALRARSLAELTDQDLLNSGAEGASEESPRTPSLPVPLSLRAGPRLVHYDARPEAAAAEAASRLEDLAAELEAALMSDLRNVASVLQPDEPARSVHALPLVQAEIETGFAGDTLPGGTVSTEAPQQDRLVVERLLARGRLANTAPVPDSAPTGAALEEQLSGELAERLSIAVDELRVSRGEAPSYDAAPLAYTDAGRRRTVLNRQLVAVLAVLALVGGGALATIQSVTARTDAPVEEAIDQVSTAGIATAGIATTEAAPLPAPAAKQVYDRAVEDPALPEAPPLRGTDGLESISGSAPTLGTALLPGSAVRTEPVQPSVRAVYATSAVEAPPAVAPESAPVAAAPKPVADPVPSSEVTAAVPESVAVPAKAADTSLVPGPARITSGVKLRGNPDNGAPTIGLLKTGDQVQVVQCKGWCEVVASGKRGFVFKKFLASVSG